jgi:hypothetical protein
MYIKWSPLEIKSPTHCNLIGLGMTVPPPPVIAQQYSSATFVPL